MDTTKDTEVRSTVTRRHLLIGATALIAVVAAGGVSYYLWTPLEAAGVQPGAAVPLAELMTPGPLGDQVQGADNAPVTIIEYASMTCPHCSHFHETTYPELKEKYIDTGKARFIFREFPLDRAALAASMLARCAGKDKFFPLIETLFSHQKDWAVEDPRQPLFAIAKQAGFTQQTFEECLANQQIESGVRASRDRAQMFNVSSTPTFFINGKIFRGSLTPEELTRQINSYLKG